MSQDLSGKQLGPYRIKEIIGRGGMGEVYRARDERLDRDVALKVLPSDMSQDPDRLARFEREAKAIAALNHPNVVTIHSVTQIDDVRLLTMELIKGQTLDTLATPQGLDLRRALDIAIPLADALACAHDAGIVHRDLKPANVMITPEGRVKVLDFGLAKLAEDSLPAPDAATLAATTPASITNQGTVLGTVPYMSPEQVRGEPVDHRSDIFSLGVILYELATGNRPFQGRTSSDLISSILRDDPPPLLERRGDLPPILARIVGRCLEKDKERRFQSIKDVRNELDLLRRELDSGVSSSGSGIQAAAPASKVRGAWLWSAAAVAVLAVAGFWFLGRSSSTEGGTAERGDNTLAVMYFENMADPDDPDRLGEITSRLLIADLSESEYVRVLSSQRLFDVMEQLGLEGGTRPGPDEATRVASAAGAQWMLMGTILRTSPQTTILAELVDVETGEVTASQRIEGNPGDEIFDLVDQLTVEVKQDLSLPEEAINEADPRVTQFTSQSPKAYRYYVEGVDFAHMLYKQEAVASFRRALAIDSTMAAAHLRLALDEFFAARGGIEPAAMDKAVLYANQAGRLDRLFIEAFDACLRGENARGAEILEQATQQFPQEKEAYLFLGGVYAFRLFDSQRAIDAFHKVLELDPRYKLAHNYLAYEYSRLGQFDLAHQAVREYISLAPEESNPYDTQADVFSLEGKVGDAIASFQQAIAIKPDQMWSRRKLAGLLIGEGRFEEAEQQLRAHARSEFKPWSLTGHQMLAWIPAFQGKLSEAEARIEAADSAADSLFGERKTVYAFILGARINALRNNEAAALEDLEKAEAFLDMIERGEREGLGERYATLPTRVSVLIHFGRQEEALRTIRRYEREGRAGERLYDFLLNEARGILAFGGGDYRAAIEHYETCLQRGVLTGQNRYEAEYKLGLAYYYSRAWDSAIETLEWVLHSTINPHMVILELAEGHYYLAKAYEESGRPASAKASYEQFLRYREDAEFGRDLIEDARTRLEALNADTE